MKVTFVYPGFERHAEAHPELLEFVPADEYLGPPSLGIASVAAATPEQYEVAFIDDRLTPVDAGLETDVVALSFFTPAATRALEIADQMRAAGKTVVAGGIFPTQMPDVVAEHVDAVVVGEGEPVWADLLADAEKGSLKKKYVAPPHDLSTSPVPRVDLYFNAETEGHHPDDYPFQLSRGCPLTCDACVLPIHMGKKMRFYSQEQLEATMRAYADAGKMVSLTEDTSIFGLQGARKHLREFLDTTLRLQQEGVKVKISYLGISMPMILNLDPTLLQQMRSTGMDRFYLVGGFDPITRNAFGPNDPKALEKAYKVIARCKEFGIDPYVSFLVGNEGDDEGTFDRMLEFASKSGIELAEFVVSTPYPGTPIWHRYQEEGRIFDHTWKHYNDANVVFEPHQMSPERLQEGYLYLWREFYRGRQAEFDERSHQRSTVQF
ncbi:MAG: radical SAM protein [Deltaproteobacteria bacterium]|nr:radical SAM protein [Deltaproteobacteria bacterium]